MLLTIAGMVGGTPAASQAAQTAVPEILALDRAACDRAAARPPWYFPGRPWQLFCVPGHTIDGSHGRSNGLTRLLLISDDQPVNQLGITVAHESAHAESDRWPTWYQNAIAKQLGKAGWDAGDYWHRPAELYAENRARCAGYPGANPRWRRLDCGYVVDVAVYGYWNWTRTLPAANRPHLAWTSSPDGRRILWQWEPGNRSWRRIR